MRKNKVVIFTLVFLLLIMGTGKCKVYAYNKSKKEVLILNSYHYGYKWSDEILDGIKQVLSQDEDNIDLNVEYMDLKRNSDYNYIQQLFKLYKYKFKYKKLDVIIATDNGAFNFLREYGDELFPNVPVVFCGVNYYEDSMIKEYPNFTGIAEEISIQSTIDLALKLHPKVKNVSIILGDDFQGKESKKVIQSLKDHYGYSIKFEYINGYNFEEIKSKVKKLPKDSVIFIATDFKDKYGQYIPLNEGVSVLSDISQIPIYSTWDFVLGDGVVGGKMLSSKEHGRIAGSMAFRILLGENPSDIRVKKYTKSKYEFDYKQLIKFGISQNKLPNNSIIINKPQPFYSISKNRMWVGVSFIIIGLTITILFLLLNISERKEAEKSLKEKEKILSMVLNSSPDIIHFKDGEGRWVEANEASINLFDMKEINYKGKKGSELALLAGRYKRELFNSEYTDEKVWKSENIQRTEVETYDSKDSNKVFDVIMVPIFKKDGFRDGLLYIGRDITEKKKTDALQQKEEETRRKLNEIMEYDKLRVEFFANISHELRTPLNVILGALQFIELTGRQGTINENEHKIMNYINVMKQNSYRLVRIVNNLIDITKIDAGYFELELKNDDIIRVVEDITLSVKDYIESKGLTLIFDTDVEEKLMAFDGDKIERIILNLLSNSIKFTKEGGSIYVNVEDHGDNVIISVEDTGIGIKEDAQKTVFERFIQVDKSFTRKSEGSGIGLSLVKSLVEMHSGKISLKSEYKKGSKFIIELPVIIIEEDEIAADIESKSSQSKVERINIEFSDIYS